MRPASGWRTASVIWSMRPTALGPVRACCCRRWQKRCSCRLCGATWKACRRSSPAGSPAHGIRSSAVRCRYCTGIRAHAWNVEELASRLGTSRTVLAERFDRFLGEPALTYLARWRLQLAARMLQTSGKSIGQIAADVGYTSQAAFNRAFKRQFDMPPVQYRRQARR